MLARTASTATLLLNRGADIERAQEEGGTPFIACQEGQLTRRRYSSTALYGVRTRPHQHGRRRRPGGREGRLTADHRQREGSFSAARLCLERGADINRVTEFEATAQNSADAFGHLTVAAWLAHGRVIYRNRGTSWWFCGRSWSEGGRGGGALSARSSCWTCSFPAASQAGEHGGRLACRTTSSRSSRAKNEGWSVGRGGSRRCRRGRQGGGGVRARGVEAAARAAEDAPEPEEPAHDAE